jgi:hypothetical protein
LKEFRLDIKVLTQLIDEQLPNSIKDSDNNFIMTTKDNQIIIKIDTPLYSNRLELDSPIIKIVSDDCSKYALIESLTIISENDRRKIDMFVGEVEKDLEELKAIVNIDNNVSSKDCECNNDDRLTDNDIDKMLNVFMSFIDNTIKRGRR